MATWTQDDVDALKAKIASGVQSVSIMGPAGRTVTYHGLDALRSLLAEMIADVGNTDGTHRSVRFASTRKGFYSCS